MRTNPHTTTVKPHRTGKTRPPKRHRASQSSQTGVRNDHREISACPHIRNTTQRPSNHRRPCQFIPIRMPRHTQPDRTTTHRITGTITPTARMPRDTQHDTSTDNPPASHTNHPDPHVTTYTTQHNGAPVPANEQAPQPPRMRRHTQPANRLTSPAASVNPHPSPYECRAVYETDHVQSETAPIRIRQLTYAGTYAR